MRISEAFRPSRPAAGVPGPAPVKALVLYDEEGWAWWHRARQIRAHVSAAVQVEIRKAGEPFDHREFDLLLLFDHPLLELARHVPREKVILGSSCPRWTREAVDLQLAEGCKAGLVNSLSIHREVSPLARVYLCQNGVDADLFRPPDPGTAQGRARKAACWVGNSKSIGNKGLDLIREACRAAGVDLLAWDKAEPGSGLLRQEEVRDRIYLQSDFYICASEFEGTPNPLLEAMACGLPAVSTAVGNAPEIIREGWNGFLAERSVAGLADAIRRLLACDAGSLSRNARAAILAEWTWTRQARKYEAMFLELAEENRRQGGNTKRDYRRVLWVDAGGEEDAARAPADRIRELRQTAPRADVLVCCVKGTEGRYASCGDGVQVEAFDAVRARGESAYRAGLIRRLSAWNPDLALNVSPRPDLLAELLLHAAPRAERITLQSSFDAMDAALQADLGPQYTRLAPDPGDGGPTDPAAAMLRCLRGSVSPGTASPAVRAGSDWRAAGPASAGGTSSRRLRVLLVAHNFPPYWYGGVEVHTLQLARGLRAQGAEAVVLHPHEESGAIPAAVRAEVDGIPVIRLVHGGPGAGLLATANPTLDALFTDVIRGEAWDAVHFQHTLHLSLSMPGIARARGIPVCVTLHDSWLLCPRLHFYQDGGHSLCAGPESPAKCGRCLVGPSWDNLPPGQAQEVEAALRDRSRKARELLETADAVVSPTAFMARRHERFVPLAPGRIEIAPLGLEFGPPHPRPGPDSGRALRFGFLGSIHPLKDPFLLADSFRAVRGRASLSFHGDGKPEHAERLRRMLAGAGNMAYRGPYRPEDLPGLLAGLDAVVACSATENYPLVLREALAAGVPVIASRVGGIPEIVSEGVDGLLFDPSRPGELARLLQSLVEDPSRLERLRDTLRPIKPMAEEAGEWLRRYAALAAGKRTASLRDPSPAQK